MDLQVEKLLDAIGLKILAVLQENARMSLSDIGRQVGLSAPAVAERVRKLEQAGIIRGYHARIDPDAIGWQARGPHYSVYVGVGRALL